jgi:hypothetical protein
MALPQRRDDMLRHKTLRAMDKTASVLTTDAVWHVEGRSPFFPLRSANRRGLA